MTPEQLRRLDNARRLLIRQVKGEEEVHLADIMKLADVRHLATSTVSNHFNKYVGVRWRTPREEPLREPADLGERVMLCSRWMRLPDDYFSESLDGMMDNKKWAIPMSNRAKRYSKMVKVRGHLRTRTEGIKKHFTKPKSTKHRVALERFRP